MKYNILLPLFLLLFIQCKQDTTDLDLELTPIFYAQTGCADPWECPCQTDEDLSNASENYFLANISSEFENLEITYDATFAEACNACSCTTGKLIQLEVTAADLPKFIEIGFQKN